MLSIPDLIVKYADVYNVEASAALAIARCESNYRSDVYGDNGLAYGVFQFHRDTFDMFAKKFGGDWDYFNTEDNVHLAIRMFAIGEWNHWTCYSRLTAL